MKKIGIDINGVLRDTIYKFKSSSPFNSCCSNDSIAVFVENSSIDAYLNFFGEKQYQSTIPFNS